jgi:hypothetical protein
MDNALTLSKLPYEIKVKAISATINHSLESKTYIGGHLLSMADYLLVCREVVKGGEGIFY